MGINTVVQDLDHSEGQKVKKKISVQLSLGSSRKKEKEHKRKIENGARPGARVCMALRFLRRYAGLQADPAPSPDRLGGVLDIVQYRESEALMH